MKAAMRAAGAAVVAPGLVRQDATRPSLASGTATGDLTRGRAVVWSRTDRRARMLVEWATTESFQDVRRVRGPVTDSPAGYTARVDLTGLPRGQRIFYQVRFEDLTDSRNLSLPGAGSFLSAPDTPRDLSFAWSADTVGQGWGINLDWGGMRMYETIRQARPDFFVHCGDTIYADGPVPAEVRLADGTTWRNVVTPAKSKVAETLDEFRGNYLYNMLDENVRRFNAEVPQFVLWDDHEVRNNWFPQMNLRDDPRYSEKNPRVLAARARQAFMEFSPLRTASPGTPQGSQIFRSSSYGPLLEVFALDLRSYRGANSANRQPTPGAATALAGRRQLQWIKQAIQSSASTWKVIASDLPLGLIVPDGPDAFEAFANTDGPPLGREHEVADLLGYIRQRNIRNVVWITGDVHYAAAHHYHPDRAQFKNFHPFWEFVAGPLHAGTFGPNALDNTFGPEVCFSSVPPGMQPNQPPSAGLQFFGFVRIAAATKVMTVQLRNLAGESLYEIELEAERQ